MGLGRSLALLIALLLPFQSYAEGTSRRDCMVAVAYVGLGALAWQWGLFDSSRKSRQTALASRIDSLSRRGLTDWLKKLSQPKLGSPLRPIEIENAEIRDVLEEKDVEVFHQLSPERRLVFRIDDAEYSLPLRRLRRLRDGQSEVLEVPGLPDWVFLAQDSRVRAFTPEEIDRLGLFP